MFAARFLAAFDQAARGSKRRQAREPVDPVDCREPPEAEALAKAGDGWYQSEGRGSVRRGGVDEGKLQSTAQRVILRHQGQIAREVLWHGGSSTALSNAIAVGFGRALLAALGQVVLAVSVLDMGQEVGACAPERRPAPPEATGSAPLSGRDRGLREQAAPKECSHLLRIDGVVFRLATVAGFPSEGMAEDEGQAFLGPASGKPRPGEETGDRHDKTSAGGGNRLATRVRGRLHRLVQHACPVVVHDTDVQTPGLQVDTTVKWGLLVVESPEVSSS
jgi:hypothetical protein